MKVWDWRKSIQTSELEPMTKLVLYTLANYMNEDGGSCFPNQDDIAAGTGLDIRSISRHIKKAKDAGYLDIKKMHIKGQRWKSNTYEARRHDTPVVDSGVVDCPVVDSSDSTTRHPSRINSTLNSSSTNKQGCDKLNELSKKDMEVWLMQMEMRGSPITINVEMSLEKMKAHYLAYDGRDKNGNRVFDWVNKAKTWILQAQTDQTIALLQKKKPQKAEQIRTDLIDWKQSDTYKEMQKNG